MNNSLCKILSFCTLICLLSTFFSCSTKQNITNNNLKLYSKKHLTKEIENNNFDFEQFQAKIAINVNKDGDNFNLKGQLRMEEDSIVWASLSLGLGLELARIKITDDSVFFLKRTDRSFLTENIKALEAKIPVSVSLNIIQSLFTGKYIDIKDINDAKVSIDGDFYKMTINNNESKTINTIWISPDHFKIKRYSIQDLNNTKKYIQLDYEDFILVGEIYLPSRIICSMTGEQNIDIEISYSNIVINNELDFPFNIPSKYDRIKKW